MEAPYETVSGRKFLLMSLCTLTMYDAYWIYRNWQRIRRRSGTRVSPLWRTVLAPFTTFALFGQVASDARALGIEPDWNAGALGAAFLVLSFVWLLPSPWVLAGFAGFAPFLPVAATTRAINARSGATEPENDGFTPGNYAAIVVGSAVLVTLVALTLMGY